MTAIAVGIGAVMLAGSFTTCSSADGLRNGQASAPEGGALATVGDTSVSARAVETAVEASFKEAAAKNPGREIGVADRAYATAGVLQTELRRAATLAVARREGADLSDEGLRAAFLAGIDRQIEGIRLQGEMSKALKPGASVKEFDAYLKKTVGRTSGEIKTLTTARVAQDLKNPAAKEALLREVAPELLAQTLAKKSPVTLDELKRTYETITVKRIVLSQQGGAERARENLVKVQADLKSGTSFEDSMNRYSTEPPLPKKTVSENILTVTGEQTTTEPTYAPIARLKDGGVATEAVETPEGLVLYKAISRKTNLPANFAANQAKLTEEYAKRKAARRADELVKAEVEGGKVKWTDAGAQTILAAAEAAGMPDPAARKAALEKLLPAAKTAAAKGEGYGPLAYWLVVDGLLSIPGADKKALNVDRIASLEKVVQTFDDVALRLQLVDAALEAKDGEKAAENLVAAAQANSTFDALGQSRFSDISARKIRLKAAGFLPAAAEKAVDDEQARWRAEREADAKDRAEQARLDAEARKPPEPKAPAKK